MSGSTCGAPCAHGGREATRRRSRSDLGWMGHCNRPVAHEGDRCWQHSEPAASKTRDCCLYERSGKPQDAYCRTNCPGFTPGYGGAA